MDETQQTLGASQQPKKEQLNIMALISYIGPLCLIPLFMKEQDAFVKFHAKQGLTLFAGEVIGWIIVGIVPILWFLGNLLGIFWLILSIIGILNVVNKQEKEVPIVGKFAARLKF